MRFQATAAMAALFLLTSAAGAQTAGIGIEAKASQPAELVRQVRPAYPPEAKAAKISGKVRLAAVAGKDGKIQDLKIVSGHPLLAAAARDAVRQWEYAPLALDGQPAGFKTDIELNFTLAGDGPPPMEVAGGKQEAKLVNRVTPAYPPEAKQKGIHGDVLVRAVIGKDGAVESIDVREGDPVLVAATVDAVKQWRYAPTVVDGAPVAVATMIHMNFTLPPQ